PGRCDRHLEWRTDPPFSRSPARVGSRQRRADDRARLAPRQRKPADFPDHCREAHRLNEEPASEPIRGLLAIADRALADPLGALLGRVPGLKLGSGGEPGDFEVKSLASSGQAEASAALTPRELEVLALLAEGASNKNIARRLGISVHTAKFHVGSLLDKLDAV